MKNSTADASVIIDSIAIAGYRSFGSERQRFVNFDKVNILIGQNNSGKSNVLRFIHDWLSQEKSPQLSGHDRPLLSRSPFSFGLRLNCVRNDGIDTDKLQKKYGLEPFSEGMSGLIALFQAKMKVDGDPKGPWFGNPPNKPKVPEVEFSKKEVLREEVEIYRQPDHGCIEAC